MNEDLLEDILIQIWDVEIPKVYKKGLICTERHLQCEIYHFLRMMLPISKGFNVWVEPHITLKVNKEDKTKIPDLIVTKNNEIIAIIELKFKPDSAPRFENDLEKLQSLSNEKRFSTKLKINPKNGDWSDENFNLGTKPIFAFFVIAPEGSFAVDDELEKRFPKEHCIHFKGIVNSRKINFEYSCWHYVNGRKKNRIEYIK